MKAHLFVVAASSAILFSASFGASSAAARQAEFQVAIIDMGYIFENHVRFKALKEDLDRDHEAAEVEYKDRYKSITKLKQQLPDLKRGSQDYKTLEEDVAKQEADFRLAVALQKKDFLEREARIHYSVYQEIADHVKDYCEQSGILLVLRFNGEPVDANSPEDIQRGINNFVVYKHGAIDITPVILESVNQSAPNPRGNERSGQVGNRPRTGVPNRE